MGMVVEGSFSSSFELSDVSPWASSLSSPDCQAASRVTWPFFLTTISSPLLRRIGMKMFWQHQKHRRIICFWVRGSYFSKGKIIRADVRSLSTWHWVKVVATTFNNLLSPSFNQVGVLRPLVKYQFWNVWPFYNVLWITLVVVTISYLRTTFFGILKQAITRVPIHIVWVPRARPNVFAPPAIWRGKPWSGLLPMCEWSQRLTNADSGLSWLSVGKNH